jgi:hypothetical protein
LTDASVIEPVAKARQVMIDNSTTSDLTYLSMSERALSSRRLSSSISECAGGNCAFLANCGGVCSVQL